MKEIDIQVIGSKILGMEMVNFIGLMEDSTQDNG